VAQSGLSVVAAVCTASLVACERKPSPPPSAAAPGARASFELAPVAADTITMGAYVQFVRPLRHLSLRGDSNDFRPYNADTEPDTFSLLVPGEQYVIAPSGTAYRRAKPDTPQRFVLPVDTALFIERLAFTRIEGDPVFVIQETDNESAAGFVVRLDSASLMRRWMAGIPGFNIGFALREGRYLYVTCIGFIGKLDLSTGKYVWRHDDLYATEKFNNFDRPRIRGDTVEFPAGGRILRVERQTGRRFTP